MGLQNYWTVRFHWQNNLVYILPFTCLCRVGRGDLFLSRERHYTSPFGASVMSFSRKKSIPTPNETETRKFYVSGLTLTVLSVENLKLKAWPIVRSPHAAIFFFLRKSSSKLYNDCWRHRALTSFEPRFRHPWYVYLVCRRDILWMCSFCGPCANFRSPIHLMTMTGSWWRWRQLVR